MSTQPFRKAAILIACLDSQQADALLEQFTPDQAQRVRNAIMDLGDIDTEEQRAIIEEFVNLGPARSLAASEPDTVELSDSLKGRIESSNSTVASSNTGTTNSNASPTDRPFRWLENVSPRKLANMLTHEHPQTAAVALAHVPPARASEVLQQLPIASQTDILSRIARLDQTAPEILHDVELAMESQLGDYIVTEPFESSGLKAVSAIVQAADTTQRRELIAGLVGNDRRLAHHLVEETSREHSSARTTPIAAADLANQSSHSVPLHDCPTEPYATQADTRSEVTPPSLVFSDLEQLSHRDLAQLLHAADQETTLLALAGASHAFVQGLLNKLPSRDATRLNTQIQNLGPIRLTDIDMAQQQLTDVTSKLMEAGLIKPLSANRFAAAV